MRQEAPLQLICSTYRENAALGYGWVHGYTPHAAMVEPKLLTLIITHHGKQEITEDFREKKVCLSRLTGGDDIREVQGAKETPQHKENKKQKQKMITMSPSRGIGTNKIRFTEANR